MNVQQNVAKGFYRYPQINGFISVKQYIFVYEDGKKYLLIRFSNDSDFCTDRIKYRVTRIDIEGDVLGADVYDSGSIVLEEGNTYAPSVPIAVEDRCVDFKLDILEVRSRDYRYHVREGKVETVYVPNGAENTARLTRYSQVEANVVKRHGFGRLAFIAAATLAIAMIVNAIHMLYLYVDAQNDKRELENKINISYDQNGETYKYFTYDSDKIIYKYEADTLPSSSRK